MEFQDWQAWLALAIALGVGEMFTLDLVLGMLAVGAIVGMVGALAFLPVLVQVLIAIGASVAMLALVRPGMVKRLHAGPDLKQGHEKLVGKQGLVVEEISVHGGQVKIAGEIWSARPYDDESVIAPGAKVDVFGIEGAMALVHEIPQLES